jgi:hypothetical protein
MPSLRQQLHDYYDAQALSTAKAEAILRASREATSERRTAHEPKVITVRRWPRILALAAAVAVLAGLAVWVVMPPPEQVPYAALAPRVIEFFGGSPQLPKLSQDKAELRTWLLAKGAPQDFEIPAKLLPLESFGCHVVEVQGRPAYLTCFWRVKKPDGTGGELIHLLAARRSDFRDGPNTSQPEMRELNGWSFAAWSEGDIIYTLAAAATPDKLRPFLTERGREPRSALATVSF